MIYLLFAVTASTLILICFRFFEKWGIDSYSAITVNYIIGAIFGFSSINGNIDPADILTSNWFPMSALTGLILISGFVLFALSAQKAGIAVTAISSRMAVIISVLLGIIVFGDKTGSLKIIGIVMALLAFYLTLKKGKTDKSGISIVVLPLAVFLFMGLNDVVLKVTQYFIIGTEHEAEQIKYAATSFLFGFMIGIPVLVYRAFTGKPTIDFKSIFAGILLGLLNWFSTYYLLKGLAVTEVSIFIPMLNISVVTISSVIGFFVFREKLSKVNWLGIGIALLAIFLITF